MQTFRFAVNPFLGQHPVVLAPWTEQVDPVLQDEPHGATIGRSRGRSVGSTAAIVCRHRLVHLVEAHWLLQHSVVCSI